MIEFTLTTEEKEELHKEAERLVKGDCAELGETTTATNSINNILEIADELIDKNPDLSYDDIYVEPYQQPDPYEDYTHDLLWVYCESASKEAVKQKFKDLCERAIYDKRKEFELYAELHRKYGKIKVKENV